MHCSAGTKYCSFHLERGITLMKSWRKQKQSSHYCQSFIGEDCQASDWQFYRGSLKSCLTRLHQETLPLENWFEITEGPRYRKEPGHWRIYVRYNKVKFRCISQYAPSPYPFRSSPCLSDIFLSKILYNVAKFFPFSPGSRQLENPVSHPLFSRLPYSPLPFLSPPSPLSRPPHLTNSTDWANVFTSSLPPGSDHVNIHLGGYNFSVRTRHTLLYSVVCDKLHNSNHPIPNESSRGLNWVATR